MNFETLQNIYVKLRIVKIF